MYWEKYSYEKIKHKVFEAISQNTNYNTEEILGLPGTLLDSEVFYDDAPFLKDAPFLSTLIANPNHIGVHTLGDEHEDFFKGTHEIEKDLIKICAEEIFGAEPLSYDGYVASGGTEANIEALWIYRNFYLQEYKADVSDIAVIYSADTHYSIPKAVNLLGLKGVEVIVDQKTREINFKDLEASLHDLLLAGYKYFIVNVNMSTTMFGSIDDVDKIAALLDLFHLNYKIHIDGAYGGFIFPFTNPENPFTFKNKSISSFSIDGHKMLQAPYGTGIFLIRKDFMKYVCTNEAGYVKGKDYTLCGSRSGANAVCVWMILRIHGSIGWSVKMHQLVDRANSICENLNTLGINYFRHPNLNIVTIDSEFISKELAHKYHLVPDNHNQKPNWYKIVVMPHVKQGIIDNFLNELKNERHLRSKT
ncbi:MAG: pyridoxal-dependent decarboxylase [Bacteroidota bacterium]|nr:pyridoxal-dependent decarboxylase [Bacteroidota bacterium]MDP3145814.1 pyridoxal-dependent decarboxylase [Bacteroidota bacterium]MDP3558448.1 pyridoxal-dependent decarboxylase [Bacteroidota bacterium]